MRNMLALLALSLLIFAGIGWWLDWYQIRSQTGLTGHQSVNIDINGSKISSDVRKGIQKIEEKKQHLQDNAQEAGKQAEGISRDISKEISRPQE